MNGSRSSLSVDLGALAISLSVSFGFASVLQDVMAKGMSLLRYSRMNDPISDSKALSRPSTATTAPRISWAGLAGPGGARGGDILVSTLILLTYGMVITIASILLAWISRASVLESDL